MYRFAFLLAMVALVLITETVVHSSGVLRNDGVGVDGPVALSDFGTGYPVDDVEAAALRGTATVESECGYWDVDGDGCYLFGSDCPDNFENFDSDSWLYAEYSSSKQNRTRECDASSPSGGSGCATVIDQIIGCTVSGS